MLARFIFNVVGHGQAAIPLKLRKVVPMSAYFSSVRALVVDENPHVCTILGAILESLAFKDVQTATSYEAATIQMELGAVDCVFVDWMETPSHGLKVVDDIRNAAHRVNPNVPIILCTGYTDITRLELATEIGVDEILVKPVEPKTVLQKVSSALYGPRSYWVNGENGNQRRRFDWSKGGRKSVVNELDDLLFGMDKKPSISKNKIH
jgi:CheY-like chemotaxis protein